jgi:hypothetical protein
MNEMKGKNNLNTLEMGYRRKLFTYWAQEMGDVNVCFWHKSQFMLSLLSVSDVINSLNVWSGCILVLPPNTNIVSLVTLYFTLCSVE